MCLWSTLAKRFVLGTIAKKGGGGASVETGELTKLLGDNGLVS